MVDSFVSRKFLTSGLEYMLILIFCGECVSLAVQNSSIWFDDAYSLAMIRHAWKEMVTLTGLDFHPPLYYFILKSFSILVGDEIVVMKLVSIIPSFLTLLISRVFLKKEVGGYSALLLPLCFMASQNILHYSVEVRMYSWALFFVTMSFLSAYYAIKSDQNRWYVVLSFFTIATFYTHYYAAVIVGIGFAFLFLYTFWYNTKRLLTLLFVVLGVGLCYVPWLFVFFMQISHSGSGFWIPPLTVWDVFKLGAIIFFTGEYITSVILVILFVFVFVRVIVNQGRTFVDSFLLSGLYCVAGLVVFGIVLSVTFAPLFISRYMIPVCGVVWLFFAGTSQSYLSRRLWPALTVLLLVSCGVTAYMRSGREKGEGFFVFKDYITKEIRQDDVLVLAPPNRCGHLAGIVAYLFPGHAMAFTNGGASQKENFTIDYQTAPFAMKIFTYRDLLKARKLRKWLIVPEGSGITQLQKIIPGKTFRFCGRFGWMSYQAGYQFDLYFIDGV